MGLETHEWFGCYLVSYGNKILYPCLWSRHGLIKLDLNWSSFNYISQINLLFLGMSQGGSLALFWKTEANANWKLLSLSLSHIGTIINEGSNENLEIR